MRDSIFGMGMKNFNIQSDKPRFAHRANPLVPHAWQILEYKGNSQGYEPVGEYILIETTEPADITEKKLTNLMTLMNGKKNLIDFKNLTDKRVLFTLVSSDPESKQEKVILRTYDGSGVSKENAVLTIEKGVFHDNES